MGGNMYVYSLTLDRSRVANQCLTWGNVALVYQGYGLVSFQLYPHGQAQPAVNNNLFVLV